LRNRVLGVGRQGQRVAMEPHEEVPAAGLRR
jgi:hypothetical protein